MVRTWRRHSRAIRLTVTFAVILYVLYLAVAFLVGVPVGGGQSVPIGPADATRNFFAVAPILLRQVIPMLAYAGFFVAIMIIQFVGLFWYMSRGRTYTIQPGEYDLGFNDVRGQPHIVETTKQVMGLFQGYKDFRKVGGYPPHGILFEGPPGTGKTLLAKAIAGETGVPFMYASGAGFVNMFMGVSNLRVARMFKKARQYSEKYGGCVIFIDELDSIGGSRGAVSNARMADPREVAPLRYVMPGMFGGGDSSLVNELLTQMDGIDTPKRFRRWVRRTLKQPPHKGSRYNILVIGATNRAATLDPALLRPGRFDRKIHVGNPGEEGRKDIIAYYLNKVSHVPIDIDRIARATAGYSPARIKNVINEALIFALQDGRDALTYDDIWKAKLTDEIGLVEPVEYSQREKAATAIHEAGHAIAAQFLRPWTPVQIVTIRKRGATLGLVHSQEDEERHSSTRSEMIANIKVSLAGMVAEEIWLGESTTGPSSDLRAATGVAIAMVAHLGMGKQLLSLGLLEGRMTDDDVTTALKDDRIRDEVDALLQGCKIEVRQLLEEKRTAMEALRDALVAHDELTGDQFRQLLWSIGAVAEAPSVLPQIPIAGNGQSLLGKRYASAALPYPDPEPPTNGSGAEHGA